MSVRTIACFCPCVCMRVGGLGLTELMGELLAEDCRGRAESRQHGHSEGGADGQAVNEVVQSVAQSYHPRHRLDVGDALPPQPVAHCPRDLHLLEGQVRGVISTNDK